MTDKTNYVLPKVWTWDQPSGGQFANINRPIAGADPRAGASGRQAPVPALFARHAQRAEGLDHVRGAARGGPSDAEYDAWPIRIGDGDQFGSGFVDVNPNSKIPALLDRSGAEPVRVFESGAILLHLAEKFGEFLPASGPRARGDAVLAVLADGQRAVPRRRLRPFLRLCAEQDRISDQPLRDGGQAPVRRAQPPARGQRIYRRAPTIRSPISRSGPGTAASRSAAPIPGADDFLATHEYEHVMRWARQIDARPAVKRGRIVNKLTGDPSEQLHERHDASDFELRTAGQAQGRSTRAKGVKDDAI